MIAAELGPARLAVQEAEALRGPSLRSTEFIEELRCGFLGRHASV